MGQNLCSGSPGLQVPNATGALGPVEFQLPALSSIHNLEGEKGFSVKQFLS